MKNIYHKKRYNKKLLATLLALLALVVIGGGYLSRQFYYAPTKVIVTTHIDSSSTNLKAGTVISKSSATVYSKAQVQSISKVNYGSNNPTAKNEVNLSVITFRSFDTKGNPLTIHAKVYMPIGVAKAPILGFGSGTTGMGNTCAPSLEVPSKANWGNYDSYLMAYAGQGYAVILPDYEGFLDPNRTMHHYMVGQLEGRVLLDSIRAMIDLNSNNSVLNKSQIFLAGYSQGGHAALWANQIATSYAPEIVIRGVVGFGSVVNVDTTMSDVVNGANLDWFGPYVLTSYSDYYGEDYHVDSILLPQWIPNLRTDVLSNCISSDLKFWGTNPEAVYTPQFIAAAKNHTLATDYPKLTNRLQQNSAASFATYNPILLNEGAKDIVVLPTQESNALLQICSLNPNQNVTLKIYPNATHYTTIATSFNDTLSWMNGLRNNQRQKPSQCPSAVKPLPATSN